MIQRHNSDLDIGERFTRESNRLPARDLDRVANAYRELLQSIGEDVNREGLQRTPDRAARALDFLTQGYTQNLDEILNEILSITLCEKLQGARRPIRGSLETFAINIFPNALKQFAVRVRNSVEISRWQAIALSRETFPNIKIGIMTLNHKWSFQLA